MSKKNSSVNTEVPEYIKKMTPLMWLSYIKNKVMSKLRFGMFKHKSNYWNERLVELPCFVSMIETIKLTKPKAKILEVGNVLHQTVPVDWEVIDKYELGKDLFDEKRKFDIVISISTLEHIGFNAIEKCKSLLNKDGILIVSVPTGYNFEMDKGIQTKNPFDKVLYFERKGPEHWELVKEFPKAAFHAPYDCANGLVIGFIKKK
jgi:SAM-dependent methyltransferase